MKKTCCVKNCNSKDARMFALPRGEQNKGRREIWLKRLGRVDKYKDIRVCFKHFCENDFFFPKVEDRTVVRLLPSAVPHLLLEDEGQVAMECSVAVPINEEGEDVLIKNDHDHHEEEVPNVRIHDACQGAECSKDEKIQQLEETVKKLQNDNDYLNMLLSKVLNPDQILYLKNGSLKGYSWSTETISKAYKIRLACGHTGYEVVRELGQPLPTERTLQRKIENLKFAPGILTEVFTAFKNKVDTMVEEEKHAAVLMDEMKIESKFDYDPGTGFVIGKPTVPSSNGKFEDIATHGLVYMLAGTTSRWKQTVGYQFTGNSFCPNAVKEDIFNVIRESEDTGVKVDVVISDMASTNRAIWKLLGISAGPHEQTKGYCVHPCDTVRRLYFSPDTAHIFKHIRDHMTNNQDMILPPYFVEVNSLPNNVVSIKHIEALVKIDKENDLKLAPHLTEDCLKPSHFEKMKVGLALRLIHNDTAAALRYCVTNNLLGEEVLSTAWFCETMYKWFKLVTGRCPSLALHATGSKLTEHVDFLREIIYLFNTIKIGVRGIWKPVQTGVILATSNALDLADYYLKEKQFRYLCLGRFTQDALENLFSTIRAINPIPSPKMFKMAIRIIAVAQFFKPSRRGNYDIDDGIYLGEFLQQSNILNRTDSPEEADDANIFENLELDFIENLNIEEIHSLYYLAGYVVNQLLRVMGKSKCINCLKVLKTDCRDPAIENLKILTDLKAISNKIIYVTREVFELFKEAEIYLRRYESCLISNEIKLKLVTENFVKQFNSVLPDCHGITERLVKIFYRVRIHLMLRKHSGTLVQEENIRCDSKSVAMRRAVRKVY